MPKKIIKSKKTFKQPTEQISVEAYTHEDTRVNIPTQELSHLADQKVQKKIYEYDPSLDPQLMWAGKSEKTQLTIDTTPIYIHEKISPKAIISKIRNQDDENPYGSTLFETYFHEETNKDFTKQVEFYSHSENWRNRLVMGDSALVMNSLLEKEGMAGKIQTIYIDPPYGIKFGSNRQVSTRKNAVKDGKDEDMTREVEQVKAFRDTWELGIHSYLTYLRDRLLLARELLTPSGSCFVQISDENVHLVRNLMDEVFGSENFVSIITFKKSNISLGSKLLGTVYDYIIWYAKDIDGIKYRQLFNEKIVSEEGGSNYQWVEEKNGIRRKINKNDLDNKLRDLIPFTQLDMLSSGYTDSCTYPIEFNGEIFEPKFGKSRKTTKQGFENLIKKNRVMKIGDRLYYVLYHQDYPVKQMLNVWNDTRSVMEKNYVVQTDTAPIQRCLLMTTDPGDLVLDPTCGSGTTAYMCEQWGRRWITVDTSRVALALTRTRLMTSIYPYFKLKNDKDIRDGFCYNTVPHITLKTVANDESSPEEILYDKPQEDKKIIRVSGPLTFEGLAPHKVDDNTGKMKTTQDFTNKVLENLRKSGIQTGYKEERLVFSNLDIVAGSHIQLSGDYQENGQTKQVAVMVGPEYGSIDDDMIRDAIKDSYKHYDLLVIAGISFDGSAFTEGNDTLPPYVNKENFKCIKVKINPDLAMDDLLKKTGTGNMFLTFGEPDVGISDIGDNLMQIEIRGVDVYDATTGQMRKGKENEIACWFIDTNYDEESFFVTHAYFTGGDKPLEKLKKALKAEVNEDVWQQYYTTTSAPFVKPKTGKIAIKVINHFGDEVMKIIDIK